MSILSQNSIYQTSDLALAATISLWYPLEAVDKTNPRQATFIFNRDHGLDGLMEKYWKKELTVEPQAFFNQLKTIKSRLYSFE